MQLFLSFMLVISFATFQLAFGDDSKVDSLTDDSKQDQEVAEFETMENDDDEQDDDAEYRWLAPEMFDEMQKRANVARQSPSGAAGVEGAEELKKNKNEGKGKKNKNKDKNKNKNKNKPPKRKFKNKGMSPK